MDCAQFEEIVHDLGCPATESSSIRASARAHVESCSRCAQLLTKVESLDFALRAIARREAGRQAPKRIEATLMSEFRDAIRVSSRRGARYRIAALGAAAAIVLAAGMWFYRAHALTPVDIGRTGAAVAPATRSAQPSAQIQPNEGPSETGGRIALAEGQSVPRQSIERASHVKSERAAQLADAESDVDFIRLPYTDDPGALADDAVVRVVLTPAALASLGLPVIGGEGSVQADLALSEDGTPQAIRLVSQTGARERF